MRSRELQVREREIDYTPIAGRPGEFLEISLYVKTRVRFGALRQNKRTFWTGILKDLRVLAPPRASR